MKVESLVGTKWVDHIQQDEEKREIIKIDKAGVRMANFPNHLGISFYDRSFISLEETKMTRSKLLEINLHVLLHLNKKNPMKLQAPISFSTRYGFEKTKKAQLKPGRCLILSICQFE